MSIIIKRIYEDNKYNSGYRVLVDRICQGEFPKRWPTLMLGKRKLPLAFSCENGLIINCDKFQEFKKSYREEMEGNSEKMTKLREFKDKSKSEDLILLFGAKDKEGNHAVVVKKMLEEL